MPGITKRGGSLCCMQISGFNCTVRNHKSQINVIQLNSSCSQYLVGPHFSWINASMQHGTETIRLWPYWVIMRKLRPLGMAFKSSPLSAQESTIFFLTTLWIFCGIYSLLCNTCQSSTLVPWSLKKVLVPLLAMLENEICSFHAEISALKFPGKQLHWFRA